MDFEPIFEKHIHPGIARAAQYCLDLSDGRPYPRRADFRPTRVRSILGYIFLIDILPEANDYHFSLFGTHISVLYGMDLTGKRVSQVDDDNVRVFLRNTYDAVVASKSVQYLRGRYTWPNKSVDIERLLVPMSDEAGNLSSIFGVTIPLNTATDTLLFFSGMGAAKLEIDEQVQSSTPPK